MLADNSPLVNQFYTLLAYVTTYEYLHRLGVSLIIFLIFLGFRNIFANYVFRLMLRLIYGRYDIHRDESLLLAFRGPVKNLFVLVGGYIALQNLLPSTFSVFINNLFRSGVIVLFASVLYNLIIYYTNNEAAVSQLLNYKIDKIVIPFFSKMLRFLVVAMAFVVIASTWGYDVNGFIAGLGLGGLAIALAAKDLLANIFSGLVVITSKPFSIGDWIKTSEVEGTVEDISFRVTKIRAFDRSLITVPNANLVNAAVTNYSRRSARLVSFRLGVVYDTPSTKLKRCVAAIEDLLKSHPGVDQTNILFAKFDAFGNSSLELYVYYYTNTAVFVEYLTIKEDINLKIMEILEREGVERALPSTSVYINQTLPTATQVE